MKKFLIISVFFASFVLLPMFAGAQSGGFNGRDLGLFPCDDGNCNFGHVVQLANSVINVLFRIVIIIAPVLIVIAGYRYIISGDRPEERKKANGQLLNLVIGLVIIACAYAVIKLILSALINMSTLSVTF